MSANLTREVPEQDEIDSSVTEDVKLTRARATRQLAHEWIKEAGEALIKQETFEALCEELYPIMDKYIEGGSLYNWKLQDGYCNCEAKFDMAEGAVNYAVKNVVMRVVADALEKHQPGVLEKVNAWVYAYQALRQETPTPQVEGQSLGRLVASCK